MRFCILILLLTVTIVGCRPKTKTEQEVNFTTVLTSIPSDTSVSIVVYYKNHFIGLTDSKKVFVSYTEDLKSDTAFASLLNTQKINVIFTFQDTLIGAINDDYYFLSAENKWIKFKQPQRGFKEPMFEDENYFVDACCVGEFGGAIFFFDKRTKRTYSCPATCATIVNKISNEYYVTNSLAHMDGSTEILKIKDPTKLYELKTDSLKNSCNWWTQFVTYEDHFAGMKKFMVGTDTLVDSIGVLTLTSFTYKDKLYNLSCNRNKTFLTKIENNRLVTIDTVYNAPLWSYEPTNKIYKNFYFHSFHNHDNSGFIIIKSDTINIVSFKLKAN